MTNPAAERPPVTPAHVRFFLSDALARGPVPHAELLRNATALGIGDRQLEHAAKKLGVFRKRLGPGEGSVWSLPRDVATPAPAPPPVNGAIPVAPAPRASTQPSAITELARTVDALQRAGRLITIWRILPGVPMPAYVTQVPASDFSLGWVKRALGGGRFIVDTVEVAIEGRPKEYIDPTDPTPPAAIAPTAAPASDINDKLFALVLKQLEVSQVRTTVDPMEMALKIVGVLRAQPAVEPTKPTELLGLINQLRELGIVGDIAPERPETNMLDVAKELAPTLNALAGAIVSGRAGAPPVATAPGGTTAVAIPGSAAAPPAAMLESQTIEGSPTPSFPATAVGMAVRELFPYIAMVNVQARNPNARHTDVAKFLLDSASPKVYAVIDDAVSDPSFVETATDLLAAHVPPDLVAWYAHLAAAIRDDIFADRRAAETEGASGR